MSGADPVRFVHLRLHSAYSLLEGAIRVKALAELCLRHGMPAVAVTDTNNLFGALEISEALAAQGVQPIIGITLAFDPETGGGGAQPRGGGKRPRLPVIALLAKDEAGYLNLMKLSTRAFQRGEGLFGPHVTLEDMQTSSAGLIALTGGPEGALNRLLVEGQRPAAEALLSTFAAMFGDRLYVELQRHGLNAEAEAETALVELAYAGNIPLVATNEVYFEDATDYEAHDALICIADGAYVLQEERRRLTPEHRFKSQEEMAALFADLPEALANTIEIAKRCAFRPQRRDAILPGFRPASGLDEVAELRVQAEAGLRAQLARHGTFATERAYVERLAYELDIIIRMGFAGYFLIVSDFMKWTRAQGIPTGVRGSGATSIVAWALEITSLDPLRFGLVFERFLNPERVSLPDFDIDFCQERRDEVIGYVQSKYGRDRVAQIITFGTLQARAVLRDVGRVLGLPYGQVDRLCKLVPAAPGKPVTLAEAIEREPRLKEARDAEEGVARLLAIGEKLEGLYRHASTHAAGLVIADRPLEELVPLYRDPRSDIPVTQFSMNWVESAGLIKFDFLGLKTLTVIAHTEQLLARRGIVLKTVELDFDDERTYALLSRGDTIGVFQVESAGMRDLLRQLKPDRIEDLIALVALYRPGPMESIPKYIACKHGREEPVYLHPLLEPILSETYGVMTYQEDVMRIARSLAGYSLGEADLLRRAMGKKKAKEMAEHRARFIAGTAQNGVSREIAAQIFEQAAKFAGYGFNKGHAAAYAHVLYQTAYLKANYPVEFMAATMTQDIGNTDRLNVLRQELARLSIELLPPDVNASEARFAVEGGKIRYALGALKNVGVQSMESLVAERARGGPFRDLFDFAERLSPQALNRRALESLIKAGAFDSLSPNRAQALAAIDLLLAYSGRAADERESNQASLFEGGASERVVPALPQEEPWLPLDALAHEFDAVGFHLSGHPLDDYASALARARVISHAELVNGGIGASGRVRLGGLVVSRRERRARSGAPIAFVVFSDATGRYEAVVFSDVLQTARELLEPGKAVVVTADAERDGEEVKLRIQNVVALEQVAESVGSGLRVVVDNDAALEGVKARLPEDGRGLVFLVLATADKRREVELELPGRYSTSPRVRAQLQALPGVAAVEAL
jgi:DNA polymerase-3 subunit alpha